MTQTQFNPTDGDLTISTGHPHNLNVSLSTETHEMLTRLARAKGLNKTTMIRQLIDWRYSMECLFVPICASGSRCHCPQMHPPPQQAPHQTLVPQEKPT